jgi:hypothetical protein
VPNLKRERSVSPCDMMRGVKEEDGEVEVGRAVEGESIHDSFYAAHTSVESRAEIEYARGSTSVRSDDTDATVRPNMMAAGHTEETLRAEIRHHSDAQFARTI